MVLGIANTGHGRLIGTLLAAVLLATACQPRAGTSASVSPSRGTPSCSLIVADSE